MCIENTLIGLRTFTKTTQFSILGNANLRIPANPNRLGFMVSANSNQVSVQTQPSFGDGVITRVSVSEIWLQDKIFRVETYGQIVIGDIWLIANSGDATGTFTELICEPETMALIYSKGK